MRPTSISAAWPERTASTASATVSTPRSRARWLRVPGGHDDQREPVGERHVRGGVDRPVAAGDADGLAAARHERLERRDEVVAVLQLDDLGPGQPGPQLVGGRLAAEGARAGPGVDDDADAAPVVARVQHGVRAVAVHLGGRLGRHRPDEAGTDAHGHSRPPARHGSFGSSRRRTASRPATSAPTTPTAACSCAAPVIAAAPEAGAPNGAAAIAANPGRERATPEKSSRSHSRRTYPRPPGSSAATTDDRAVPRTR